jgi:adenosylcobyric acid synthase
VRAWDVPLRGYEIHHGQIARAADDDWLGVGLRRGAVYGTHWHGLLDNDDVRRQWLGDAALAAGRAGFVVADDVNVSARRDEQLDLMADLLAEHLDVEAIMGLLDDGAPRRPTITSVLT